MTKKALVVLAEGFEDIEAVTPIDLLRRAGIDVTVAGLTSLQVQGSRGQIRITADATLDQSGTDYDAIVLPGGMPGAKNLAESPALKQRVLQMNLDQKVIAAICATPAKALAAWGILNGKKATCFPGSEKEFSDQITFEAAAVVIDGHIITSRGAGTAYDFGLAIIEALTDKATRDQVAQSTVYET